jgi:hypothetical protein
MLRKSKFGAFGSITLVTALAAVAASAVTTSGALAVEGGPVWVVKGVEMKTETEKEALTSEGGQYTLTGTTNITCETEKATGELLGGNPGRGLSSVTFEKCHEEAKTKCLATNVGEDTIFSENKTVLVYPHGEPGIEREALVAITPDTEGESENLFTEFTLKNESGTTACSLLNGFKVDVLATGTLINDPSQIKKKCGLLAQVGKLAAGIFSITKALEENAIGALNATGVGSEATIWETTKKTSGSISCKLEAFGEAHEEGVSDVLLSSNAAFGWNK